MAAHIVGFLGGFAFSIILYFKKNIRLQFNNPFARKLYYISIIFLILLPLTSIGVIAFKKVSNYADYSCKTSVQAFLGYDLLFEW